MTADTNEPFILGIYPTSRGFGWIAFSTPTVPYHWGVVGARGDKNAVCLRRLRSIIERIQPSVIVLEAFERPASRTERIERLCKSIVAYARSQDLEVAVYTRREVERCFATVGAKTRLEIAEAVASHVPLLHEDLPRRRRAWDSEDRRMALFAAAAVVLTHFKCKSQFFPEDQKAA